jgi:hypothetical protein
LRQGAPAAFGQKANCALICAKRAEITEVGVSQAPPGMNAWL